MASSLAEKKEEERVFLVFGKVRRLKEQEHKNIANELIKKKKPFGILANLERLGSGGL